MYIHIYLYIHIYIHMYIHIYMHVHMFIYKYMCTWHIENIYAGHDCTHMSDRAQIVCVCVCVCVCACVCVCVCVYSCDTVHSYVWHDVFICKTRWPWYFGSCTNRGYFYGWHDADKSGVCICATWFILINDMTHSFAGHSGAYMSVRGQIGSIHKCDMTHPCAWHDLSTCVTWLIHMCDMTHSYVWQIRVQDTVAHTCWFSSWTIWGRSYVWHDTFLCVTWLVHMFDIFIHMCHMTHSWYAGHSGAYMSVRDMCIHVSSWHDVHITHQDIMNESCHTLWYPVYYKWVMSHTCRFVHMRAGYKEL